MYMYYVYVPANTYTEEFVGKTQYLRYSDNAEEFLGGRGIAVPALSRDSTEHLAHLYIYNILCHMYKNDGIS